MEDGTGDRRVERYRKKEAKGKEERKEGWTGKREG